MVLEELIDEVKKMFDNSDTSVKIDQGKDFLKFKKMREGFTASEKNLNELDEMHQLDSDLHRSISNYATVSKILASDSLKYLESEKNLTGLKETNIAIVKRNPYANGNYEGCFADKDFSAIGKPINNGEKYSESSCRKMAIEQNSSVYGLQDIDENGKGLCVIGDNLEQAKKYGSPSTNEYGKNNDSSGIYGGYYTCPDGSTYEVGEVAGTSCGALDGVGGVAGECFKKSGPWSGNKVVCGKVPNDKDELVRMGYVKKPSWTNPPLKLPSNISKDGRCGPQYGNKVCQGNSCCSQYGWCGGTQGTTSAWCSDGQQGVSSGKYDGKPILQTSVTDNKNNPPTYIGGKAGPDSSRDHSYVFKTREQAESACKSYGYERLASTEEVRGWELCATGWTSDGTGGWWWGPNSKSGCGSVNSWNSWKPDGAGAWCYGTQKTKASPLSGCKKGDSGSMIGTKNTNAVYSQNIPENADLRKVGYINDKGFLSEYPKSMIKKGETYTIMENQDSPGNDLIQKRGVGTECAKERGSCKCEGIVKYGVGDSWAEKRVSGTVNCSNSVFGDPKWGSAKKCICIPDEVSSVESCKNICNNDDKCAGFTYKKSNKRCLIKSDKMYPESKTLDSNNDVDLYIRNPSVNNNATCSNKIVGVDSHQFKSFKTTGKEMTMDRMCGLASDTKDSKEIVKNERNKIMSLSEKIVNRMDSLTKNKDEMNNLQPKLQNKLLKSINNYKQVVKNIKSGEERNETIGGQVDNSDLLLINRNFNYVMWSILAIIAVIVTIKVMKR